MPILDDAKLALRITGTAYEPEIMRLIATGRPVVEIMSRTS